jgi:GSH-dependent disulfide-bond oxidoreductase
VRGAKLFGQDLEQFPRLKAWFETIDARPAVQRGVKAGEELRKPNRTAEDIKASAQTLFGQTAKVVT